MMLKGKLLPWNLSFIALGVVALYTTLYRQRRADPSASAETCKSRSYVTDSLIKSPLHRKNIRISTDVLIGEFSVV